MDINYFLNEHLKSNKKFHAVVISVDIAKSRTLAGSDNEKARTKAALRNLCNDLIGQKPMAILDWRGDGGLIICDASKGLDDSIQLCDMLVGLIPFFNRSRQIWNFLPFDMIHLRIVCNYGLIENTGDSEVLTKDVIDNLFSEKTVGVIDHVVITKIIYDQLHPALKTRFSLSPNEGTPLGSCYILDNAKGTINIENHEGASDELRRWIAEMALKEQYNELLIFSYTNETLYQYFTSNIPSLKVRVLMRNWVVERKEEIKYNSIYHPLEKAKTVTGMLKKRWEKAHTIRAVAEQLMDQDKHSFSPRVDIRFYDEKPFFKGAILRSERDQVGYLGFYRWDPDRKEGGSPYIGENWPSLWVTGNTAEQRNLIEFMSSRFEELWDNGLTYDDMLELEKDQDSTHEKNIENVFSADGCPYLIIYPGVPQQGRLLPEVASEDMSGAYAIKDLLEDHGNKVSIEVVTSNSQSSTIHKWNGHIIAFCHRSINQKDSLDTQMDSWPYRIVFRDDSPQLYLSDLDTFVKSPIDYMVPENRDLCLITKSQRTNGNKIFFIAGLHAIGTWGGTMFLVNKNSLSDLALRVRNNDFSVVINCPFSIPNREIFPAILHGPIILSSHDKTSDG